MSKISSKTPVLILGLGLNGLGVLRNLRSLNNVFVADTDLKTSPAQSFYGKKVKFHSLTAEKINGFNLIDDLLEFRKRFLVNPILFLTQEETVRTIANHYDQLKKMYHLSFSDPNLILRLLDKSEFKVMAEQTQAPIPKTLTISSESDLKKIKNLAFPVVLKPDYRKPEFEGKFKKAYKISSQDELIDTYRTISQKNAQFIVQEWIEGGDQDIYFCLLYTNKDFEVISSFVGQKLYQWPVQTGGTACCTSAPQYHDELTALTLKFFKAVGFHGFGSMEYKRDPNTGNFYMIEPTVGRTDFQHEVSTLNGINMSLALYAYETRKKILNQNYSAKRIIWYENEALAKSMEVHQVKLQELTKLSKRDALFRLYDPIPYLHQKLLRLTHRFKKRLSCQ